MRRCVQKSGQRVASVIPARREPTATQPAATGKLVLSSVDRKVPPTRLDYTPRPAQNVGYHPSLLAKNMNKMESEIEHIKPEPEKAPGPPAPLAHDTLCIDGNQACTHVAYYFTENSAIYPITPSTPMGELMDAWASTGMKNLFGLPVNVAEMQSEAGAAGSLHGIITSGMLGSTFTASQGLLLMIPNMFKIAGQLLPVVIHVSARTIATASLCIFGDHSDVMTTKQTGFALLCSGSVQEAHDMALVAHIATLTSSVPFLHFFDGFRTSHEVRTANLLPHDKMRDLVPWAALAAFKKRALLPTSPMVRGTAQGPDLFMQGQEAGNRWHMAVPAEVTQAMETVAKATGRRYKLFDFFGPEDSTDVVVLMGSGMSTAREAITWLNAHTQELPAHLKGKKFGVLVVRLYSPWDASSFMGAIPATCRRIAVLDRCKTPGGSGEPLFVDVITTVAQSKRSAELQVIGGRYGLGSKEFNPEMVMAVFDNLNQKAPMLRFSVGIIDDISKMSIPMTPDWLSQVNKGSNIVSVLPKDICQCVFWGLGADGTVGANKEAAKIISELTGQKVQAYFDYDAKKSGGRTLSHLRFGPTDFDATYLITDGQADYVACHAQTYPQTYKEVLLSCAKKGAIFLMNCAWTDEELPWSLPWEVRKAIIEKDIQFYIIDAYAVAREAGLGRRVNMILQTAFFAIVPQIKSAKVKEGKAPEGVNPFVYDLQKSIKKLYAKKGEKVLESNLKALKGGETGYRLVNWKKIKGFDQPGPQAPKKEEPAWIQDVVRPALEMRSNYLPVSKFMPDGSWPSGTTQYEKRGIAMQVPEWHPDKCTQCNYCSVICPHAAIRPVLASEEEYAKAPKPFQEDARRANSADPRVQQNFYKIQLSPYDCTGCQLCATICPDDALTMRPLVSDDKETEEAAKIAQRVFKNEAANWDWAFSAVTDKGDLFDRATLKGSQFYRPLQEYSGACEGCGETPYTKLLTQLFGDRVVFANATGCSSIWGASAPATPYRTDSRGRGPAWANSLFEDNAEFGLGHAMATETNTKRLMMDIQAFVGCVAQLPLPAHTELAKAVNIPEGQLVELVEMLGRWLGLKQDRLIHDMQRAARMDEVYEGTKDLLTLLDANLPDFYLADSPAFTAALKKAAEAPGSADIKSIVEPAKAFLKKIAARRSYLLRISHWALGGDGWAFDIGYGGLDHVMASGSNVKVLVMDTEVYSNTGGQASKATPRGAVAKFAEGAKQVGRKDLGEMMISYGSVYVASTSLQANPMQTIKALVEAQAYDGPAIVLGYAPCIAMGFNLSYAIEHASAAVSSGYWPLYRFNPSLRSQGHNPFQLDSSKVSTSLAQFMQSETRFSTILSGLKKGDKALEQTMTSLQAEISRGGAQRQIFRSQFATEAGKIQVSAGGDAMTDGIIVLYGSETGNAEGCAQRYAALLQSRNISVQVSSMDDFTFSNLKNCKRVVMFCSTAGQGQFPQNSKGFWNALSSPDLPTNLLEKVHFSMFGLGDSRYFCYCLAAKKIDVRMSELGATKILPIMFGDDVEDGGYHVGLERWKLEAGAALGLPPPVLPAADGTMPAPPPLFNVHVNPNGHAPDHITPHHGVPLQVTDTHRQTDRKDRIVTYYRVNTDIVAGQVAQGQRKPHKVTETKFRYRLGDSLCIHPWNAKRFVDKFLSLAKLDGNTVVQVLPTSAAKGSIADQVPEQASIRQLFTHTIDLNAHPARSFYESLAPFATNPKQRLELLWLAGVLNDDQYHQMGQLSAKPDVKKRLAEYKDQALNYVDALAIFNSCLPRTVEEALVPHKEGRPLNLAAMLSIMPLIKPRAYSIASSPLSEPNAIDLTIGLVDWARPARSDAGDQPTDKKETVQGLCTGAILDNKSGVVWNCSLHGSGIPGHLFDQDPGMPVVMVALGTGLAPMRALVQHRRSQKAAGLKIGEMYLVYGAQYSKTDWTFGEDFERWHKEGVLTHLAYAWSRDQKQKIYVHDRIREHGQILYDLLVNKNGIFVLCGGSRNIPDQVKGALTEAFMNFGKMTKEEGDATIRNIGLAGKYVVECWG